MSTPDNFNPLNDNKKKKASKFFSWLKTPHRLVVINDESFKEEKSVKLSSSNILIFSIAFLAIWILTLALGLRFFGGKGSSAIDVSNYSPDDVRHQILIIHQNLDSLTREIENRDIYIEQISRLLNNNLETEKDIKLKQEENKKIAAENAEKNGGNRHEKFPEKIDAVQKMVATSEADLQAANLMLSNDFDSNVKIEQLKFVAPLRGIVTDSFAPQRKHYGIDIVAPKGSVIKSTQAGTVIVATWSADTGHLIGVQHANNVVSFYKHNSSLLKKAGDKVQAGDAIAIIGNTGSLSEGPHLHFEIWYYGQAVNPKKYVDL